jgi:hypothetical protein
MERSFQYWRGALMQLRVEGLLADARAHDVLARSMMIYFLGGLNMWTLEELSDEAFRAHIMHGIASLLSALDIPAARSRVKATVADAVAAMQWPFDFRTEQVGEAAGAVVTPPGNGSSA